MNHVKQLILGILLFISLGSASLVMAEESGTHTIVPGENLYRIALQYGISTEQLAQLNGITNYSLIYVGQELLVPGEVEEPQLLQEAVHIVQPGENLYTISVKYGIAVEDLRQVNQLGSNNYIYSGQALILPTNDVAETVEGVEEEIPIVDRGVINIEEEMNQLVELRLIREEVENKPLIYQVQSGDTLWKIAQKFQINVAQLQTYNNIQNPNQLLLGKVLYIPNGSERPPLSAPVILPAIRPYKQVVVDISEQWVYAYENGELVHSFIASTGAAGMETRVGTFYIENKLSAGYNYSWGMTMPNWMGIYWAGGLQNGFHALPVLSNGYKLWAGYLGTPISYGCIVLGDFDSAVLYEWAEVGTEIVIQQ